MKKKEKNEQNKLPMTSGLAKLGGEVIVRIFVVSFNRW
jgi:hypothetical protein